MIHLDTSTLIDALAGRQASLPHLRRLFAEGHRVTMSTLVLWEWLRGPRSPAELHRGTALFEEGDLVPFGATEALVAASLYRSVRRPRGREIDLAIAACAIAHDAVLWTLNPEDFEDVPGLRLAGRLLPS